MCTWIAVGVLAYGHYTMPDQINGPYFSSCDTSYCRAAQVCCTPQLKAPAIVKAPSKYGYSSAYNYGVDPR